MVGSAWSEREKMTSLSEDSAVTSYNSDMIELSRQQRMNTDVRRNIFCTVMTSEVNVHILREFKVFQHFAIIVNHVIIPCTFLSQICEV